MERLRGKNPLSIQNGKRQKDLLTSGEYLFQVTDSATSRSVEQEFLVRSVEHLRLLNVML